MINLTSVQNGGNQYLVYDLMANPHKTDNDTVMMINSNYASGLGLAKISFEDINGEKQKMLFDITGMSPVNDFLSREITQEAFRYIILQFAETISNFENYMIDLHQVVFDTDYVFINIVEQRVFFLCMPFTDSEPAEDSGVFEFFRGICSRAFSNVVSNGHSDYTGIVANILKSKSSFSISNLISALNPEAVQHKAPVQNTQSEAVEQKQPEPVAAPVGDVAFTGPAPTVPQPVPGVPVIAMPDYEPKPSGSLFGKMKGMLKKNEDAEPKSKKEKNVKKEKAPKKEKASKKDKKAGFSGGLAGLSGFGKAEQEVSAQVPVMPGLQNGVQPQQPEPQQMSAANDSCHTIYVSMDEPENAAPSPESAGRINNAMQNLFGEMPAAPVSENSDKVSDQIFGGAGILGGGMFGTESAEQGLPFAVPEPKADNVADRPADISLPEVLQNNPVPAAETNDSFINLSKADKPAVPEAAPQNKLAVPEAAPQNKPAVPEAAPQNKLAVSETAPQNKPAVSEAAPQNKPAVPEAAPQKKTAAPAGNNHAVVEIHAPADTSTELMTKASIIYLKTNMKISLETPVVRVGRSSRDVEVRLPDSIHVGRHHAEFRRRGTEYVLVDMNSSNHTLLNGKMIDPEKEYKLKNGDSIVFADEKFEYRTEE